MRAVIISAGSIKDKTQLKKEIKADDFVICADGGYDHAKDIGIQINVLLGDLDSISSKEIDDAGIELVQYPTDKDYTDTELALTFAYERGADEVLVFGAMGTRMDHTFANILMLTTFNKKMKVTLINEHNKIFALGEGHRGIIETVEPGVYVSLIPIDKCEGITTKNLKYELTGSVMEVGYGRGVSNVAISDEIEIVCTKGNLIVMISKD